MKNTCPFQIAFQDLKMNNSYKSYKIKPPVPLFAVTCVTLDYQTWEVSNRLANKILNNSS